MNRPPDLDLLGRRRSRAACDGFYDLERKNVNMPCVAGSATPPRGGRRADGCQLLAGRVGSRQTGVGTGDEADAAEVPVRDASPPELRSLSGTNLRRARSPGITLLG